MYKWKNHIAILFAVLLIIGGYLALSPLVTANFLLYLPKRVTSYSSIPEEVFGAKRQYVAIQTTSGHKLFGVYFQKPGAYFTVLLHHGQGGNLITHFGLAKTMLLAGCSVFVYDYTGFGMSSGTASNKAMLDDGTTAYNFLADSKKISPSRIIQCGVSLGSAVASHLAQHYPCAAVILISPYTSINQVAVERIPLYRLYPQLLFPQPDMGSLAFIKGNKTIPVLLIHGANDPIINVDHAKELDKLAQSPHWLVIEPNAHHGDFSTVFLADQIKAFVQRLSPSWQR